MRKDAGDHFSPKTLKLNNLSPVNPLHLLRTKELHHHLHLSPQSPMSSTTTIKLALVVEDQHQHLQRLTRCPYESGR
jgi:hypothetical protein